VNRKTLTLYALKYDPFAQEIPTDGCLLTPAIEHFILRVETLASQGGFALITGDPGTGKSVALRLLVARLSNRPDIEVGVLTRPQSNVADFYRELGDLFRVPLRPHNRWAGAKDLRVRWTEQIQASLFRPVLVVDEAQEMTPAVFSELRLLSSSQLDSRSLLTVVLAGDERLTRQLRKDELAPIASRIRVRLMMKALDASQLAEVVRHVATEAGNPRLMSPELISALAEHAAGNLRALMILASELVDLGAQRGLAQLDEGLFLETSLNALSPGQPADKRRRRA
jgi:type II secretory pathway predicted ATPase ExeA